MKDFIHGLKNEYNCCGCSACYNACKFSAIEYKNDSFGFKIPYINIDLCRNCNMCKKVCFEKIDYESSFEKKGWVVSDLNAEDRILSASGGIFRRIAKVFLENEGIVFGAKLSFDNYGPVVEHVCVDSLEELDKICGSLYVESDCSKAYKLIEREITKNKKILFCGMSCQIDGLYRFLGKKFDNLYTIDLIDHGVPSLNFFSDYVFFLQKKFKAKVVDFKFRKKVDGIIKYIETVTFDSGKIINIQAKNSAYYYYFLNGETYRNSCYTCRFSSLNKPSDITIGDYFELEKDYPKIHKLFLRENKDKFYSSCIVHTKKGDSILRECSNYFLLHQVEVEKIQKSHSQLKIPTKYSKNREKIINLYNTSGYKAVDRYHKIEMFKMLPRRIIKKCINFLKK